MKITDRGAAQPPKPAERQRPQLPTPEKVERPELPKPKEKGPGRIVDVQA